MANRESQNDVVLFFTAVESNVASPAAGMTNSCRSCSTGRPSRGASGHVDSLFDEVDGFRRGERIARDQKVGQPFQIGKRSFRMDQTRHDLAIGLVDFLPATRALR